MAGERRRLVADALLEAAVAADHERVVVDDLGAEPGAQVGLGEADADAVGEALAERTGGDLDARRCAGTRGGPGVREPHWRNSLEVVERRGRSR